MTSCSFHDSDNESEASFLLIGKGYDTMVKYVPRLLQQVEQSIQMEIDAVSKSTPQVLPLSLKSFEFEEAAASIPKYLSELLPVKDGYKSTGQNPPKKPHRRKCIQNSPHSYAAPCVYWGKCRTFLNTVPKTGFGKLIIAFDGVQIQINI